MLAYCTGVLDLITFKPQIEGWQQISDKGRRTPRNNRIYSIVRNGDYPPPPHCQALAAATAIRRPTPCEFSSEYWSNIL